MEVRVSHSTWFNIKINKRDSAIEYPMVKAKEKYVHRGKPISTGHMQESRAIINARDERDGKHRK